MSLDALCDGHRLQISVSDNGPGGAKDWTGTHRARGPRARLRRNPRHRKPALDRYHPHRGHSMRIALADDSVLLREGLARILADEGLDVVAVAHDANSALAAVAGVETRPDVPDVRMPPTFSDEGIQVARQLREDSPEIGAAFLSQHVHAGGALELFEHDHGGIGYLLKDRIIDIDSFLEAIRRIADGGANIDPLIVQALVTHKDPTQPLAALTKRERDTLALMAEGLSNTAIAAQLVISLRTVETHVNNVFLKLRLRPTETTTAASRPSSPTSPTNTDRQTRLLRFYGRPPLAVAATG